MNKSAFLPIVTTRNGHVRGGIYENVSPSILFRSLCICKMKSSVTASSVAEGLCPCHPSECVLTLEIGQLL